MTNSERLEALKRFLADEGEYSADEIAEAQYTVLDTHEININNGERVYLVLTEGEADAEAAEAIKSGLWAFNADFIIRHTEFWNDCSDGEAREAVKALQEMQSRLCESCNALIFALIADISVFIADAIDADGRGHFISWYDGEEGEARTDSGEIAYIYRTE